MAEIQSSGSVQFDGSEPSSGILADFAAEQAAAQEAQAREAAQMQWAEAVAKDHQREQKNRHSQPPQAGRYRRQARPWDEREARRRERSQRERHANCFGFYTRVSPPDASLPQKEYGGFWGPLREWWKGFLGL